MNLRTGYVPLVSIALIVLILNIAPIMDSSSLPLAVAEPEISLSPSTGNVGTTVDVRGSGFERLSSIQISFNDEEVSTTPENIRTNGSGRFNAQFEVPQSIAGNAIVTVSETLSEVSVSSEFTVLNEAPVAESLDLSTDENTPLEISLNSTDANGDSLTFAIDQPPEHGTLSNFDADLGTVTYTPNANYTGNDRFEFTTNDGELDSNAAVVTITIISLNSPPSAESQELIVEENGELHITLTGSDPDGDELTFRIVEEPAYGTLEGDSPNLVYLPSPDYHGNDSFAFVANDGGLDSDVSTISITIIPARSPPTATALSFETSEGQPISVTLIATDTDSDDLNFVIISPPSHGTLGSVATASPTTATVTYNPAAGYIGQDSFTYRIDDEDGSTSNIATVSIYVSAINNAPLVSNQRIDATAGLSIEIILNGNDPDNDVLSFFVVEDPRRGTLGPVVSTGSTSASVVYTPDSNEYGSDSFTFRANDGALDSNLGRVSITVSPSGETLTDRNQESSSEDSDSASDSTSAGTGSTAAGAGTSSSPNESGTGSTAADDNAASSTESRGDAGQSTGDELPAENTIENDGLATSDSSNNDTSVQENEGSTVQEGIRGQSALQSLAGDAMEGNVFMSGPTAWLLPGAIAGLASVIAFLGYRERRVKKGYSRLEEENLMSSTEQQVGEEDTSEDRAKAHGIQDRVALLVSMNKIRRILNDEKGTTARENIFNVEYDKNKVSLAEYNDSKSIAKSQFEEIGSMLRTNPQLKDSFLDSYGELTIKVWWAIKQDVLLDERRGRKWESLEWLGNEAETYWSRRNGPSSSET